MDRKFPINWITDHFIFFAKHNNCKILLWKDFFFFCCLCFFYVNLIYTKFYTSFINLNKCWYRYLTHFSIFNLRKCSVTQFFNYTFGDLKECVCVFSNYNHSLPPLKDILVIVCYNYNVF